MVVVWNPFVRFLLEINLKVLIWAGSIASEIAQQASPHVRISYSDKDFAKEL